MRNDFETILICAERYACGRMTYMPDFVIRYIRPLLPKLSVKCLTVMRNDLEHPMCGYGDDSIDRPGWINLLTDIRHELARRADHEDHD